MASRNPKTPIAAITTGTQAAKSTGCSMWIGIPNRKRAHSSVATIE